MNKRDFPKIHFYDQDFVDIYDKTWNWLSDYWIDPASGEKSAEGLFVYPVAQQGQTLLILFVLSGLFKQKFPRKQEHRLFLCPSGRKRCHPLEVRHPDQPAGNRQLKPRRHRHTYLCMGRIQPLPQECQQAPHKGSNAGSPEVHGLD